VTPLVLVGTSRSPCRAHILVAMLAKAHGAALARAVLAEVLEAARRGVLCEVVVDRDVDDSSSAYLVKRES